LSSSLSITFLLFLTSAFCVAQNTLTVAAAADLAALAPELAQVFEKANPTVRVRFVTEASAVLAQQIENGAPYDLFMSANAKFVDRLVLAGQLAPRPVVYATGRLAMVWRDGKHHNMNDLAQKWVRFVALANPQLAPYGAAAREALEHAQLWPRIKPKVGYGENVRQTLQLFDSGNADAVLTAAGLVMERNPQMIPADWHQPIVQKAGIVTASAKQKAAALFLRFLEGSEAQEIFARHGFGRASR